MKINFNKISTKIGKFQEGGAMTPEEQAAAQGLREC